MLYKTLKSFRTLNHYQEDTLMEKNIFQFHFRDDTNDGSYILIHGERQQTIEKRT